MADGILDQINNNPIWSFFQLVDVEGGECMQVSTDFSLHAEIIDNKLVVVVTPLDLCSFSETDSMKIKNYVKQEIWDRFGVIPSVVLFHPGKGFY